MGNVWKAYNAPTRYLDAFGWDSGLQIFPFNNPVMRSIGVQYSLSPQNVLDIFAIFCQYDSNSNSLLSLENFLEILGEMNDSILSLYASFLFDLVPKKDESHLEFAEFVVGVYDFVMLNDEQLTRFVFRMLDQDQDEFISLKDVLTFVTKKVDKELVFPINLFVAMEKVELDLHTSCDRFLEMRNEFQEIIFPAFQLQNKLKIVIMGREFWEKFCN